MYAVHHGDESIHRSSTTRNRASSCLQNCICEHSFGAENGTIMMAVARTTVYMHSSRGPGNSRGWRGCLSPTRKPIHHAIYPLRLAADIDQMGTSEHVFRKTYHISCPHTRLLIVTPHSASIGASAITYDAQLVLNYLFPTTRILVSTQFTHSYPVSSWSRPIVYLRLMRRTRMYESRSLVAPVCGLLALHAHLFFRFSLRTTSQLAVIHMCI